MNLMKRVNNLTTTEAHAARIINGLSPGLLAKFNAELDRTEQEHQMNANVQPHIGDRVSFRGIDFVVVEINKNRKTGVLEVTLEELGLPKTSDQKVMG